MGKQLRIRKRIIALTLLMVAVVGTTYLMQEYCCHQSSFDTNRLAFYHKEPENTMDIVVMGSSDVYAGYSAGYAYKHFGITSYPYTISGAPVTIWKPMLEDILQTQKPEMLVVEAFGACYDDNILLERNSQGMKLMDNIPLSTRKLRNAIELAGCSDNAKWSEYLFPFIKFHNYYGGYIRNTINRIKMNSLDNSPLKGVSNITRTRYLSEPIDFSKGIKAEPLGPVAEKCLREFLEYCNENEINVLMVKFPQVIVDEKDDKYSSLQRAESVGKIANEYGYPFLNLQYRYDEIGLKHREDYYNSGHLNVRGQSKATDFLCRIILDEYGIKPRPKDASTKQLWKEAVNYYDAYYMLNEEMIRNNIIEELGDSPELIERIKARQL